MPQRIKCPTGHTLIVADDRAGRTLRCPRCGEAVVVPGGGREVGVGGRESGDRKEETGDKERAAVAAVAVQTAPRDARPPGPVVRPKSRAIPTPEPPQVALPASVPDPPMPAAVQPDPQPQMVELLAPVVEVVLAVPPPPEMAQVPLTLDEPTPAAAHVETIPPESPPAEAEADYTEEETLAPFVLRLDTGAGRVPPPLAVHTQAGAALHSDASRTLAVYQLAAALAAAALFSVAPAVWDVIEYSRADDLATPLVARWALVLLLMGVVQLAYAVYLFQLPDWATVWVVTMLLLFLAAGYAAALGLVLISEGDGWLVGPGGLQLADKLAGGQAALWCLCMVSVATILAFFAGRMSVRWQRAERMLRGL